jgi:hypothetical protein
MAYEHKSFSLVHEGHSRGAKENLLPDLDRRIREFDNLNPYARVIEPDL